MCVCGHRGQRGPDNQGCTTVYCGKHSKGMVNMHTRLLCPTSGTGAALHVSNNQLRQEGFGYEKLT